MRTKKMRASPLAVFMLGLFFLFAIIPLFLIVVTAFKSRSDLVKSVFLLPNPWRFDNIAKAWIQGRFGTYYLNSVLVVIPVVLLSVAFSLSAGYALTIFKTRISKVALAFFLIGLTLPMEAWIIQAYFHLRSLSLLDSHLGLVLTQVGMSMPFGVFFMQASLRGTPSALIDASRMDGASPWTILIRIVAPLSKPANVTLGVLFFVWTWNEFFLPLVMISSDEKRTLPVGMAFFQGKYSGDIPLTAMGAAMMILPIVLLYIILRPYFIGGLTAGAVKE
ncbi:carbohydrate ABC transporter permease [Treponema sp.]